MIRGVETMEIDIQKEVNPKFKPVWQTVFPYNVLKGGRNSFKSSVLALLLVYLMIPYLRIGVKSNVVVIRKTAATIRDSVFNKMQWALSKFGLENEFKMTVAPFKITHLETGSAFHFYGQDDFAKLKSNDINDIIGVWYEEAAEFANFEEFDQTNVTFMRQKHRLAKQVYFFWSYNPPRNPYNWINEWAEDKKNEPNYLVHESSYLDDELGFVTDQMYADIERIKRNDPDYYRYIYLGEPVGLGTNVYNIELFRNLDSLPDNEHLTGLYYAIDSGHQISATTCLCVGYTSKGNAILLDTYYYSPAGKANKKAPSELSVELNDFIKQTMQEWKAPVRLRVIDSAEGALRNQYMLDFGIALTPVAKKKNIIMVDFVQDFLAQGRFYYLDKQANEIFIDEHKKYQWDEKTLKSDNPQVIKEDDHTCDSLKYLCITVAQQWGIKA